MTNVQLLGTLLGSPRRFFDELDRQPRYALPLWLLLLTSVGILVWYYQVVDTRWLLERSLEASPRAAGLSEADRDRALRMMTPGMLAAISVLGGIFFLLAARAIEALWYRLAGAATGTRRGFRHWFALANWTSLVLALGTVPAALMLALGGGGQVDAGVLQPLSINELFVHRSQGQPGYALFSNVGLLNVVSLALAIYGVRCWSRRSWGYAAALVLLPVALVVLPWTWFSLGAA